MPPSASYAVYCRRGTGFSHVFGDVRKQGPDARPHHTDFIETHVSWSEACYFQCPPMLAGAAGGRGALPPNPVAGALMAEHRTVMVAARVTPAEHAAWQDRAAAAGVSPSALLRQAIGAHANVDRAGTERRVHEIAFHRTIPPCRRVEVRNMSEPTGSAFIDTVSRTPPDLGRRTIDDTGAGSAHPGDERAFLIL